MSRRVRESLTRFRHATTLTVSRGEWVGLRPAAGAARLLLDPHIQGKRPMRPVWDRSGTLTCCRLLAAACVASAAALGAASPAVALTPDSPEVREAVAKGIAFLETTNDGRLGAKALVGLTLAKSGASPDHPKIKEAIEAIQNALKGGPESFREDIYSTGVAIMFLVAVNPKQYAYEIEALVKSLHLRQKSQGAWGYPLDTPNGKTCDTSMTQFAVLGLWEAADQAGVATPPEVWDRVADWLFQTQDPGGGFGYQGSESGDPAERVKQPSTLHSMTVAGLCSVYICKDQVGLSDLRKPAGDETPAALQPVESEDEGRARVKSKLDPRLFAQARADGNHWLSSHFTIDKPNGWLHYYLYGLERYETFRQAEGTAASRTQWYEQGARFLLSTQRSDGSWESQAKNPPDTCFALLFLLRSTKKSLDRSSTRFREGILAGGRGVPAAADLRLREGKLVVQPAAAPLDQLLAVLETPEHPGYPQALEALHDLGQHGQPETLDQHAGILQRLARAGSRETRLAAIRAMGRSRNLDHVPLLISSLDEPDLALVLAARDGLRSMSRRYDDFGLDLRASAAARKEAIDRWKAWYRSIRPDAELD